MHHLLAVGRSFTGQEILFRLQTHRFPQRGDPEGQGQAED